MAGSNLPPLSAVPISFLAYRALYLSRFHGDNLNAYQGKIKAISAGHAAAATIVVVYALSKSGLRSPVAADVLRVPKFTDDGNLDDSDNPLIQDRSNIANAITAWETGYLLYDTWAMIHCARLESPQYNTFQKGVVEAFRKEPAEFAHHLALSAAFLYLQYYISKGRERGIWIVAALILMNASTPLLQLRWWTRRKGKPSTALDIALATAFALFRFGSVAWILGRYGAYHGLTSFEAYRRLRTSCQTGTGALVGFNALWWSKLVYGIIKRTLKSASKR